jgi:hypothetical protein
MNGPRHLDNAALESVGWDTALTDCPGEYGAGISQVEVAHYRLCNLSGCSRRKRMAPEEATQFQWLIAASGDCGAGDALMRGGPNGL